MFFSIDSIANGVYHQKSCKCDNLWPFVDLRQTSAYKKICSYFILSSRVYLPTYRPAYVSASIPYVLFTYLPPYVDRKKTLLIFHVSSEIFGNRSKPLPKKERNEKEVFKGFWRETQIFSVGGSCLWVFIEGVYTYIHIYINAVCTWDQNVSFYVYKWLNHFLHKNGLISLYNRGIYIWLYIGIYMCIEMNQFHIHFRYICVSVYIFIQIS